MNLTMSNNDLNACVAFFISGAFCGVLCLFSSSLIFGIKTLIFSIRHIIKGLDARETFKKANLILSSDTCSVSDAFNAVFITIFGVFLLFLNYVYLDGVFRIYPLMIFFLAFALAIKILSKQITSLVRHILSIFGLFFAIASKALVIIFTLGRKRTKKID